MQNGAAERQPLLPAAGERRDQRFLAAAEPGHVDCEPTSGVEPTSRRRFWDLIHTLAADGVTVLVSTHYMDEAEYCHRAALINQGRIIALGSPDELKRTALGGELLLLECDVLGPMLAALQQAPGVVDASVFGNAIHVLVHDAGHSLVELPAYLEQKSLRPSRLERIHPSLEDVFVRLIAADMARGRRAA